MPVAQSKLIKERLAAELARCTREKFKSIPSHQQFAKHFFASSKYSLKVSGEAVRKWFKGEALKGARYNDIFTRIQTVTAQCVRLSLLR